MNPLINALKSEIARLARKELKDELQSLRKATTGHRSEIAALKRQVKSLASALKTATKAVKASKTAAQKAEEAVTPGIRFSADRLIAIRAKLGITKAELGLLVEASYQSVHKWEESKAKPRTAQLQRIAAVSKLGKRAARRRLEELASQRA